MCTHIPALEESGFMVTLDKHIWQIAPVDGDQGRSTQIISSMLEKHSERFLNIQPIADG